MEINIDISTTEGLLQALRGRYWDSKKAAHKAADEIERLSALLRVEQGAYDKARKRELALYAEVCRVTEALSAARSFIDSHVADPDITVDMAQKYSRYQDAMARLSPASSRRDCCQYHKDGGDTEAVCCDTPPRERFSV